MKVIRGSIHEGENCKIDPTVVIDVDDIYLGDNVTIGPNTIIRGGEISFGDNTFVDEFVRINTKYFRTGEDSVLRGWSRLEGTEIKGKHRFYMNYRSKVGGGNAFDYDAFLHADNWLHLGEGAELNTARGITIGREVAIGPASKAYTHGVWGPLWEGRPEKWAPIIIGDFAWMTYARIHPGVTIGHDSVIATGSLVDVDVPSGSHVMGVPISKYREKWKLNQYPRKISDEEKQKIIQEIAERAEKRLMFEKGINHKYSVKRIDEDVYKVDDVTFHMALPRRIEGFVTESTKVSLNMFIDQARRKTLRFDYKLDKNGKFVPYPILE
jgi:acetyltransferase-like isoleucine patch superfamily enzyme